VTDARSRSDMTEARPRTNTAQETTTLLRSSKFAQHDEPSHVENQFRLDAIEVALVDSGLLGERFDFEPAPAELEAISRIHDPAYIEWIEHAAKSGGGWIDADTYLGRQSYEVARLASGAAVAAVDFVLNGKSPTAFALVRPPGHHATRNRAMGFCIFNHIAIAAMRALDRGLDRVAIVDWDVHHGNGTQDAFYESPSVLYCSVHQSPFYPGTGMASERGSGSGEGFTINVPLRAGQGDAIYVQVFDDLFLPAIRAFAPELLLISAGYDAHESDPLGGMLVTEDGFATMARRLVDVAGKSAAGRIVAVLEGGYDLPALAGSVLATIRALDGEV
jgi:acetoin utilization deacetylase AcuC-like enzyme